MLIMLIHYVRDKLVLTVKLENIKEPLGKRRFCLKKILSEVL